MLRSQKIRKVSPQVDSLRLGVGWSEDDLSKPHILIESAEGQSHPGSQFLNEIRKFASYGITENGGKPVYSYVSDICDGLAQGHDGMNFSLASREMIANMVEIHCQAQQYDAVVLISSCDKSIPAHLMAAGRVNLPSIHIPGGTDSPGPNLVMHGDIISAFSDYKRGKISESEFRFTQIHTCPSCGACQFMGTANTMQAVSEALGMALPTSANIVPLSNYQKRLAKKAGKSVLNLLKKGIKPKDILTKEAFENAVIVHAGIGGSTNALLHLPVIAKEAGIDFDVNIFNKINQKIPYLTNIHQSGKYPVQWFWFAGGVQWIIKELIEFINKDCLTVTGKTVIENLKGIQKSGFFEDISGYLKNFKLKRRDIIRTLNDPNNKIGSTAVLTGNLAPDGAVVKYSAFHRNMFKFTGKAAVFNKEEDVLKGIFSGKIKPGTVIILRYEGPKSCGMPELFLTTQAISSDPILNKSTALVTDGRFSGGTSGPVIGHVSPEGFDGGPIALVENEDVIEIDIKNYSLNIVGIKGKRMNLKAVRDVLKERKLNWKKPKFKYNKGIMAVYTRFATSAIKGAYIKVL